MLGILIENPQPYFNSAVSTLLLKETKSESAQDVNMYHKHSQEEGKRGHWLGRRRKRRKRKAVVIRAEHYSKCRRMQVVPMVLDEVLLSCWATKQFIYKTVTAYRHGRGNCYAYCPPPPPNQSMPHFSGGRLNPRHKCTGPNCPSGQTFSLIDTNTVTAD